MSDLAADEKRAKQLEEARKRVEELKKKSKKGKKGKKEKKGEEEADSSQPATADEATPELELKRSSVETALPGMETSESVEVEKTEPEKPLEDPEDLPAKPAEEVTHESTEEKPESAAEKDTEKAAKDNSEDVQDLFQNDGSNFLSTIQKQKEDDEVQILKSQLETANADLRRLKFVNMDQESTIEELQQQVALLQMQLESSQHDLQTVNEELQKAKQISTPLQFAPFNVQPAQHESHSASSHISQNPQPDRSVLDRWRNWNIDMTTWRSIGSGPIVEF